MTAARDVLRERLALEALTDARPGELAAEVDLEQLGASADRAAGAGLRLASLFATDDGPSEGLSVHQLWASTEPPGFVRLWARVPRGAPRFPSISARHPVANWFEREVMDYFGLSPEGHPNHNRVALHDDWPEDTWVLRKDFDERQSVPRVGGQFRPYRPVTGEGVFHIPVGPVHAGIIEPGHFRFGVAGEPVLYLQLRLFYVHKGIEKRFERLPWRHGLFLAESISGDCAVGHALAYAHALERLTGVEPPPRARHLRVVLLELERIYNHVADIGGIATGRGLHRAGEPGAGAPGGPRPDPGASLRLAALAWHRGARRREVRPHRRTPQGAAASSGAARARVRRPRDAPDRLRHLHRPRGRHGDPETGAASASSASAQASASTST
jgi:Ni,Fe-hydrogenase III component G